MQLCSNKDKLSPPPKKKEEHIEIQKVTFQDVYKEETEEEETEEDNLPCIPISDLLHFHHILQE